MPAPFGDEPCSRCGAEMEHGLVYASHWAFWVRRGRRTPVFWPNAADAIVRSMWRGFGKATAPARRCTSCRIVEISYEPSPAPPPWRT